jgi:anti-sigma regulatory factor (Ser/Thr protein kinase)
MMKIRINFVVTEGADNAIEYDNVGSVHVDGGYISMVVSDPARNIPMYHTEDVVSLEFLDE